MRDTYAEVVAGKRGDSGRMQSIDGRPIRMAV
jgi:hypothetical protein